MVSTVWSVFCLLFFYSRCPPCPGICKSGEGHGPLSPVPHVVGATGFYWPPAAPLQWLALAEPWLRLRETPIENMHCNAQHAISHRAVVGGVGGDGACGIDEGGSPKSSTCGDRVTCERGDDVRIGHRSCHHTDHSGQK